MTLVSSVPNESDAGQPTSVYLYYDRVGLLIYVGITSRGSRRNTEHNKGKDWWQYVHRQEVEHYPTRAQASSRERSLIREFCPPFNVQHNPNHERVRQDYLSMKVGHWKLDWPTALKWAEDLGNWLPLTLDSITPIDSGHRNRVILRTKLEHAPIADRFHPAADVKVFDRTNQHRGQLSRVMMVGPICLVTVIMSRRAEIGEGGFVILVPRKKEGVFDARNIHLRGAEVARRRGSGLRSRAYGAKAPVNRRRFHPRSKGAPECP